MGISAIDVMVNARAYRKRRKGKKNMNTWISWLLCMSSLVSAAGAQAQQPGSGTERAIAALEKQWLQSQKTNNSDLLAPLLADQFIGTGADGKVMNKAQALADAKATKNVSAEYENVQVAVFGDTAIATGVFNGKGTDASGKPFDVQERWTDSWVKMPNGKWQCVATHSSPVKK